jgi:chemotaxis methyl-accepting protein methylase
MVEETSNISGETYFFRDLEIYREYSELFRDLRGRARDILSLPCSTGQEPYSIALLTKDGGRFPFKVHGIDVVPEFVGAARKGVYWCSLGVWSVLMPYFERGWLERHHTPLPSSIGLRVSDDIKRDVSFSVADALEKRVEGSFDVIFCCNFLYLLNPNAKERAMQNMLPALKTGGFLILDSWTRPDAYMHTKYRRRQTRHNAFLAGVPGKYGLQKLGSTEVYQKL